MKEALSVISGLLSFLGFIAYVTAILRRRAAMPQKVGWLIWASLDIITLVGMWAKHALNGQIVGSVIGGAVVTCLAWRYGRPGWSRLDIFCLAGAALGILAWLALGEANIGIVVSMAIAGLGSLPIFVSTWQDPRREDRLSWTIWAVSCVFALLAMPKLSWEDSAQPFSYALLEVVMMWLLYFHRPLPSAT